MIINIKQKLIEILPEQVPEGFINFVNSLKDEDCIITVSTNDTQTTTTESFDVVNEIYQIIVDIYLNFLRLNNLSEAERKKIETIVDNLRNSTMKVVNSFNEQIVNLKNRLNVLENEVNTIKSKQIEMKRLNIIAEILGPLKKKIFHEMLNGSSPIPSYYYDVNILKCLSELNKNDIASANIYINIYRMDNDFNQETLNLFKHLLITLSFELGIDYGILLSLLKEEEKRNFDEHSIISDFIKDSLRTNDTRLTSLIRQHGLIHSFNLSEMHLMNILFTKYFGDVAHRN
jgi:acylphosphatase